MPANDHGTLTANTVKTVTVTASPVAGAVDQLTRATVDVINVNGVAAIYFTVDGTEPTIGGSGCRVLPAAIGVATVSGVAGVVTVKLISAGTPAYAVQGG